VSRDLEVLLSVVLLMREKEIQRWWDNIRES
jgi:hypothetical protein